MPGARNALFRWTQDRPVRQDERRLPPPGPPAPRNLGPAPSRALPARCERNPPMLPLLDANARHFCDGLPRRGFLQIGGLGAVGLALPDLFRARAQGATPPA